MRIIFLIVVSKGRRKPQIFVLVVIFFLWNPLITEWVEIFEKLSKIDNFKALVHNIYVQKFFKLFMTLKKKFSDIKLL